MTRVFAISSMAKLILIESLSIIIHENLYSNEIILPAGLQCPVHVHEALLFSPAEAGVAM
jgi:hypothetical protein